MYNAESVDVFYGLNLRQYTVGKKTVRMFVIIQGFLNNSRTIKAMDLKILGHSGRGQGWTY